MISYFCQEIFTVKGGDMTPMNHIAPSVLDYLFPENPFPPEKLCYIKYFLSAFSEFLQPFSYLTGNRTSKSTSFILPNHKIVFSSHLPP